MAGNAIAGGTVNMDYHVDFALVPRTLTNLMTFTSALAGVNASPITNSGQPSRPYEVDGSTFTTFTDAWTRSCNNQHNSCADAANANQKGSVTTGNCDTQQTQCLAAQSSATQTNFQVLRSQNADFDFVCDS